MYANIADFSTSLTIGDGEDCDIEVQHEFQFAVGVAAGAYVARGNHTWGPTAATEVPMFPTTFDKTCITTIASTITTAIDNRPRQEEDGKTTVTTEVTQTAVQCNQTSIINCPASAQIVKEHIETYSTIIPSGSDAIWPDTITAAIVSTRTFGADAVSIGMSTGKPGSEDDFVDDVKGFFDKETGGVSNKIIVGVSVGLGVPVILAFIAGIV